MGVTPIPGGGHAPVEPHLAPLDGQGSGSGWGQSVLLPVALALPWVLLVMGMGPKNGAILNAIWMVESGGRHAPPDGDGGRAIGPYQIHEIYWKDAVSAAPELAAGLYQDCRMQDYAEAVIRAYMRKWVRNAWRTGNAEVIARTHNGGPDGAQKQATEGYWEKVQGYLR